MKVIIIDNFDSFTYNLSHIVEPFVDELVVVRSDKVDTKQINEFDRIILSPGPGLPSEIPVLNEILNTYFEKKPILGVCLGMQAIVEFFGGNIYNLPFVLHGVNKSTFVSDSSEILFKDLPKEFKTGRYHSWAICQDNLPDCLKITAIDKENIAMALSHKTLNIKGVQFHPESVLTEFGKEIIKNWFRL